MGYIYALIDPRTGDVRYIGKTARSPEERLKGHIWKAKGGTETHNCRWIRKLLSLGLVPVVEVIRMVEDKYLNETEIYCIDEYKRIGCKLTNGTKGGDGGFTGNAWNTPEVRAKSWETRRKNGNTTSYWKGKKQPQEMIDKRMAWFTPEKIKAASEKRVATRKSRTYPKQVGWNKGGTISDEAKANLRQKGKEQWAIMTPEERAASIEHGRKGLADYRARIESGEIEHPCIGSTPWNKGMAQGSEHVLKAWESRRAAGFVSQIDMLKIIAEDCGHSWTKVERSLKGYSHKVSEEANKEIWGTYRKVQEQMPKLVVKECGY